MAKHQVKIDIGKILSKPPISFKLVDLIWVIHDYFSLPQEPDWCFLSPEFTFLGVKWMLAMGRVEDTSSESSKWITLGVTKGQSSDNPIFHCISYKMTIEKNNGEVYVSHNSTENFLEDNCAVFLCLEQSQFLRDKDEIMPNGNLIIHCFLKAENGKTDLPDAEDSRVITTVEIKKESKPECSLADEKETLLNPEGTVITTVEVKKDSKTECSLSDEKETLPNPAGTLKLSQDFKELLLN